MKIWPEGIRILKSILLLDQPFDQRDRLLDLNMKRIVDDPSGRIDNHLPGGAARSIVGHDLRGSPVGSLPGNVGHGDLQIIV